MTRFLHKLTGRLDSSAEHRERPSRRRESRGSRGRARFPSGRPLQFEALEARTLLSAAGLSASAPALAGSFAQWSTSPSGNGLTPAQIAHAYGFDNIRFAGGIVGNGSGQTIAIIDAYDDPKLVNSTDANFASSDLRMFDLQFGLPDPPSFTKVGQTGSKTSLPAPAAIGSYAVETTMDVEWAHALAPGANILLVEANDVYGMPAATAIAANWPGVSVISLSYGAPENQAAGLGWNPAFDQIFSQHPNVTFVVSSGDEHNGEAVDYPSTDPYALSVGGTAFYATAPPVVDPAGDYVHEEVWNQDPSNASGGGLSSLYAPPAWQPAVTGSASNRATPDVSFHSYGSCYIYDSYDSPSAPWSDGGGGTSMAAPSWGALIAIADQGASLANASGPLGLKAIPALYATYANSTWYSMAFHDITVGNNNYYYAVPGYDMATGLGTPHADIVAEWLAENVPAPTPTSPADGASLTTSTPTISWSAVNGATGYQFVLTDTTIGTNLASIETATNSYTVSTPLTADRKSVV
jgi:subtilase family serine protease